MALEDFVRQARGHARPGRTPAPAGAGPLRTGAALTGGRPDDRRPWTCSTASCRPSRRPVSRPRPWPCGADPAARPAATEEARAGLGTLAGPVSRLPVHRRRARRAEEPAMNPDAGLADSRWPAWSWSGGRCRRAARRATCWCPWTWPRPTTCGPTATPSTPCRRARR